VSVIRLQKSKLECCRIRKKEDIALWDVSGWGEGVGRVGHIKYSFKLVIFTKFC
jgi:hypothetical protein